MAFSTKGFGKGVSNCSRKTESLLSGELTIASFLDNTSSNQLVTEVEKLKSPSVLMSVFEYVKTNSNQDLKNMRFRNWEKMLDIKLQPRTTILNIGYVSTDKDFILPVLDKISDTYKKYSGKQRLRKIDLGIDHFEEQIKIFKEKSFNKANEIQEFASKQDLRIVKNDILKLNDNNKELKNEDIFTSIEYLRVQASNNMKVINEQLDKISKISSQSDEVLYFADTIIDFDSKIILNEISDIDLQLASSRAIFRESDDSIQSLILKRKSLLNTLFERIKGFLEAKRDDYTAKIKAYERPKGVLVKYRQLLSDSAKDKSTLNELEVKYRQLLLEKARVTDPWQLITKPTLNPIPVAPNKKLYLLFGLVLGFFLGIIYSLFRRN